MHHRISPWEGSLKSYSLHGRFPETPPLSLKSESFLPASVISCHFIYPSAQCLSQDIVTGGLFQFLIRLWDPSWQTLLHSSMHLLHLDYTWHIADAGQGLALEMTVGCCFYCCSLREGSCGSCCLVGADVGRSSYWLRKTYEEVRIPNHRGFITKIPFAR